MNFRSFLFVLFLTPALFAQSVVIGIAGASEAGKTTLAKKLKEAFADLIIPNENELVLDFFLGHLSEMITSTLTYKTCLGQPDA